MSKNRDIKFRHWFPSTKVMTAGHDVHTFILTSTGKEDFWKECIWMQYTGLKDKNGKEIYEGDIFRIEEDNITECDFCDGTGTLEGSTSIETTCTKCDGTGISDQQDTIIYVVIVWVHEWTMFATLTTQEYKDYLEQGATVLDEPLFWTYTLEDTNSRKHFLCGNIHQNPELLNSES